MAHKKPKTPAIAAEPTAVVKSPRLGHHNPDLVEEWKPVWRFHVADHGGLWSIEKLTHSELFAVLDRLKHLESMTWHEVAQMKSCGQIEVAKLCRDAQERLAEIHQDDVDTLFKIRLNSAARLWGIRDRTVFKILWWDRDHTVYPMDITDNSN